MPVYYRKKKKSMMPNAIAVLVVAAIVFFVFRTKEPPPATTPDQPVVNEKPEPETTGTVALVTLQEPIPQAFPDAPTQKQFEQAFLAYYSVFAPPAAGTMIRVERTDGTRISGELTRVSDASVTISTPDGIVIVPREEITPLFRQRLFAADFSRGQAEANILSGNSFKPSSTARDIVLPPESARTVQSRRFSATRLNARYGPGRHYAVVPGAELLRGQLVHAVLETNGWICVRSEQGGRILGWIPKFSSFVMTPENRDIIAKEVNELMDSGVVVSVDAARNEALVDIFEWNNTEPEALEGMSRLLAFYCGQQKNSRLFWVDIRDALNNRRLAEYSESKGFRIL